ncbi:unnamed protein product [Leuciscus chuanchicus]
MLKDGAVPTIKVHGRAFWNRRRSSGVVVVLGLSGDKFSEIYLWHMHSLMCVFQSHIQEMERESNSLVEVKNILNKVHIMLLERKTNNFMSLQVKGLLAQKHKDGLGERCDHFSAQVQGLYSSCLEYLEKWMAHMQEFSSFTWMDLSETPDWNDIEACIKHLEEKGVPIDDAKCFDQVTNLKKFTERCNSDGDFNSYEEARLKANQATVTSNLESDEEPPRRLVFKVPKIQKHPCLTGKLNVMVE